MNTFTVYEERLHHQKENEKVIFGFWLYLMSDCLLFASLFVTYMVLRGNTFGGPSGHDLFSLPFVLTETIILLTSSVTCGLAIAVMQRQNLRVVLGFLAGTFLLGTAFIAFEVNEFAKFIHESAGPDRSGFLSAFFTLVGTHGLHVTGGLFWMLLLGIQLFQQGFTGVVTRRLFVFSLFWHFLDIVWIFIFSFVYLMGISM